ncbi:MAG: hypothetical protein H8F28_13430 [Fibrella sp.]|nr:hypothetical protein [Armatimonadota bacterium]
MSTTQVIFKPGGVIALVVVAAVIIATIIGFRGRNSGSQPVRVPAVVADKTLTPDETVNEFGLTAGEVSDKEVLATLNAAPGQSRDWLFLGPLLSGSTITGVTNTESDAATMRKIISTSYLPTESKYKARENSPVTVNNATYRWRKAKGSAFNFKEMFTSKETPFYALTNVVVYGYTTIESKGATEKRLRFRSDDGAIVWINGQQVYMGDKIRGIETGEDIIPLKLRPGRNNVLVKVAQGSGGWGMSFHIEDMSAKTQP